jgi:branched-chain amino acid transport system permease protein
VSLRGPSRVSPTRRAIPAGVAAAVILVVAFLGPGFLSQNLVNLGTTLFTLIIISQSWNLIGGYAGQFSMGQSMFVGLGGYAAALAVLHSGIPIEWAVVLSGIAAGAVAAIFALPVLRLRGVSFSVGTLALALAIQAWMVVWRFGGRTIGLNLPQLNIKLETQYYVSLAIAVVVTAVIAVISKSTFGLRLMSVRDDEDAAKQVGVNTFMAKFWAFAISALFAGIAGALVMIHSPHMEPRGAFDFNIAVTAIVACVIGGLSTVVGPLIGTVIVYVIQQVFLSLGEYDKVILGVVMLVVILAAPEGLWGLLKRGGPAMVASTRRIARIRSRSGPKVGSPFD